MNPLIRTAALLAACTAATAAGGAPYAAAGPGAARDPLVPPRALYATQSLPALHVTVIGFDRARPARSLAVVRMDSDPPLRRVVYVGARVGEYRIVRIEATRLEALAPVFGGTARVSLAPGDSAGRREAP